MGNATSRRITLGIGNLHLRISTPRTSLAEHIRTAYAPFLVPDTVGIDVDLDVTDQLCIDRLLDDLQEDPGVVQEHRRPGTVPFAGTPGGAAVDTHLSKPNITRVNGRIVVHRSDYACALETDRRRATAWIQAGKEPISVETVLRISTSALALAQSCLLLHASGLIRRGRGYLFPGPSNTGKSTIIGFCDPTDTVLSDEMVLVGQRDGAWVAWSTPFFGTNRGIKRKVECRLHAVFLPVRDTTVSLCSAAPRDALQRVLISVLSPGGSAASNQRLLDLASELVANIPCYDMHFTKDPSFWKAIDSL